MSYWYLGSPYSKYPYGTEEAFMVVCIEAGRLIRAKVPVYSPIAHTHPIAVHAKMDELDHTIWMPADLPMMHAARKGLIILKMESWETSYGLNEEKKFFEQTGRPIVYMEPGMVPQEVLS
jgi:hypothetical protein